MNRQHLGRSPRRLLTVEPLEERVLLDVAPIGPIRSPDNLTPFNAPYYAEINQSFAATDVASLLRIRTLADAAQVRAELIQFVWKNPTLPTWQPQQVIVNVASPLGPRSAFPRSELPNLNRVDRLTSTHDFGYQSNVYLFYPRAGNQRLAIWQQGHDPNLGGTGGYETVAFLLERGYTVLATWLPLYGDNEIKQPVRINPTCTISPGDDHPDFACGETATFTPLKYFLEPITVSLNYALARQAFTDVSMIGLSGGGWLTTVYAALDPRIRISIPVAGTQPDYLRARPYQNDAGDWEQSGSAIYRIADFLDMYVLGATGAGRRQLQVLNQFDDCCFAGVRFRTYLDHVKDTVTRLGDGAFDVFLDDAFRGDDADTHQVSPFALASAIPRALDGGPAQVVDDGENTYWNGDGTDRDVFRVKGEWTELTGVGFGRDARTVTGSGSATATWQFKVKPGRYQIAVTWIPGVLNVTNAAPYTIHDGLTQIARVNVNQQAVPGDFQDGDVGWKLLGEFVVTGSHLQISLSGVVGGAVIADGMRIAPASHRDYVRRLYRDLLQREADAGGLDAFATQLNEFKLTRTQAVQLILGSREYRELVVRGLYRDLLRRDADANGLAAFVQLLENGASTSQVRTSILGSAEYFRTRANNENRAFLGEVYLDVLGRPADPIGLSAFSQLLAAGTPRGVIVQRITASLEARRRDVTQLYRRFLNRDPDPAGLNAFVEMLQGGARAEQVVGLLLGSAEYFERG